MTSEIALVTGKELAVIGDDRPWHVRVWDSTGCEEWEQHVLAALQNSNPHTLASLAAQLEDSDPRWAIPAKHHPAKAFYFPPEVLESYARRPRRVRGD